MELKPNIKIKKLTSSDIISNFDTISNLLKSSYDVSFINYQLGNNYFVNKVNSLIKFVEEDSAIIFGAYEGELVGFIWGYPRLYLNEMRIHINHFVIDESMRGLGIGSILMKELENHAIKNEIKTIEFIVTSDSPSVGFHKKSGYKIERYQMLKRL